MNVGELGEIGLIQRLADMVTGERRVSSHPKAEEFGLLVDVGDDTAAWRCGPGTELSTTDTVVEGVHFTRATIPWNDLGWKLMAANASDIAAMGGLPLYALVALGLPSDTEVEDITSLYQGMLELANRCGIAVVGGDVVRSPVVFVTVALNGTHEGSPMLRSTAVMGDQVAVTGYVGSSAGGLELLLGGIEAGVEATAYLKDAHRRPQPCLDQGRLLSRERVRAAMDVSDGLVGDLSKLCAASGVAARVYAEAVPVHPLLKEAFPGRSLELALEGGEDYQLLFTASERVMDRVLPQIGSPAAVIGEIVEGEPGSVMVVDTSGVPVQWLRGGWDHFR